VEKWVLFCLFSQNSSLGKKKVKKGNFSVFLVKKWSKFEDKIKKKVEKWVLFCLFGQNV